MLEAVVGAAAARAEGPPAGPAEEAEPGAVATLHEPVAHDGLGACKGVRRALEERAAAARGQRAAGGHAEMSVARGVVGGTETPSDPIAAPQLSTRGCRAG